MQQLLLVVRRVQGGVFFLGQLPGSDFVIVSQVHDGNSDYRGHHARQLQSSTASDRFDVTSFAAAKSSKYSREFCGLDFSNQPPGPKHREILLFGTPSGEIFAAQAYGKLLFWDIALSEIPSCVTILRPCRNLLFFISRYGVRLFLDTMRQDISQSH